MERVERYRWRLIAWLFVLSAVAYLDRVNITIAAGLIAHDYNLGKQQLGYIFSSLLLGYALFQAPAGRVADRLGARATLTIAVIWWAVFSALTASVPVAAAASALPLLLVVRFALGTGEAVMYPGANRIVAKWIPIQERGLANGLIFMGVGIGAGITPPLIANIMVRYGWRASFIACSAIGLLAGAVWFAIARDTPDEHARVTPRERDYIRAGIPAGASAPALPWRTIFGDRNVRLLTVSYFCYGYSAYIFFSWFYIYLNTVRGLDLKASATYTMFPLLAMAVGSAAGGIINDRVSKLYGRRAGRCGVAILGITLAAVFIAVGTQVQSARLASLILAGGAGSLYLAQSSFWSVSADIAGSSAGAVSGVMNMGAQFGGVITASLTPWIADHFGWSMSFLVAACLCVIGAAAWTLVVPTREIGRLKDDAARYTRPAIAKG